MSEREARGGTLVIGGGFAGGWVARYLGKRGATIVSPENSMLFTPLLPARLAQLLEARGVELVLVPDEEFASMGSNVLALAPRVALAVEGNPRTRERMERAGVEVLTYRGQELSKGDGGPTCLTRPLLRA